MEILNQLSTRQNDKTELSNRNVAEQCISNPDNLEEIVKGFADKDKKLQSDCIEVCTMVAENNPELIVPYADKIIPLLKSKVTKTRWEAAHTLSFIANLAQEIIASVLPDLQEIIEKDKSTVVRDYSIDIIANYAGTDKEASVKAFKILQYALHLWDEKHAKQAIKGLSKVLNNLPSMSSQIKEIVQPYLNAKKKVVITEVKKILKQIEKLNT